MEVLVALFILGLAVLPVLLLFPSGARQGAFTEGYLEARLRASSGIESWVARRLSDGLAGAQAEARSLPGREGAGLGTDPFETMLTATPVPGRPGLWEVRVLVEWDEPRERGRRRHYELARLVADAALSLSARIPLETVSRGQ